MSISRPPLARREDALDLSHYASPPIQRARPVTITYEAPKLIQSQISAWTSTVKSTAVVTALFAGVTATMLGLFRTDPALAHTHGDAMTLLIFSSYAAILFNCIATLASLFFIHRLGAIELNEARKGGERSSAGWIGRPISSLSLLRQFGASKGFRLMFFEWFVYVCLGTFFMLVQVLVYMWLRESQVLGTVLVALTVSATAVLFVSGMSDF
ncbi:hypothetical protein C8F01DRAFT_1376869 [Mycena amicta]|nr:hypothetical protein C8F01DRAFT_1376869 [Mycena amicta]